MGQGRQNQGGDRQDHQHDDAAGPFGVQLLGSVLESPDHKTQSQDQQQVGQDRPDESRFDDIHQAGAEREQRDEQLRQVAQGGLQHPGGARSEPVAELFHRTTDQRRQQGDRQRGTREGKDSSTANKPGEGRQDDSHDSPADDDDV
jgi:hypothetical protein